jgi:hypothetical protein
VDIRPDKVQLWEYVGTDMVKNNPSTPTRQAFPEQMAPPYVDLAWRHYRVEYGYDTVTVFQDGQEILCAPIFAGRKINDVHFYIRAADPVTDVPKAFQLAYLRVTPLKPLGTGNGTVPLPAGGYYRDVTSGDLKILAEQID